MNEEIRAATIIHRIADRKTDDIDKSEHLPEMDQYRKNTRWLIRELKRAAHWAEFGHDPGDGGQAHSCKEVRDG